MRVYHVMQILEKTTFYTRDRREWVYLSGTRNPESALCRILYNEAPRLDYTRISFPCESLSSFPKTTICRGFFLYAAKS